MSSVFQDRLLACRKEAGKSQEKICKEMDMVLRSYCRYERGEAEPSIGALIKLADYFGVSIDYLVGRTDQRTGTSSPGG